VAECREFIQSPHSSFVKLIAPRTAVGVTKDGSIILLVVDGVEAAKEGVDLYELAEILIEQGALHAINLDGGGSSDAVLNGEVWSKPSCDDVHICERPVTSVTCMQYPKEDNSNNKFLFTY